MTSLCPKSIVVMSGAILWVGLGAADCNAGAAAEPPPRAPTGATAGGEVLPILLRTRAGAATFGDLGAVVETTTAWPAAQTALILCDVWDTHTCPTAVARLNLLAPKMDAFAKALRAKGVLIVHAPSDCMASYEGHPARLRAIRARSPEPAPPGIGQWRRSLPGEPKLPVDDTDGGCDCLPPPAVTWPPYPWKREHPAIVIDESVDAITADGAEVWNLLGERGIGHVLVAGVHTNMCVAGRPFGLRSLVANGRQAALVRDLTDSMYNPARAPYVSHRRGTELVIEHLERYVAPSVMSDDVLGRPRPPMVAFIVGEAEYDSARTLPAFAKAELEPRGIRSVFINADPTNPIDFPEMGLIKDADAVVLAARRASPKADQLAYFRQYLEEGRPLIALRTASHAFELRPNKDGALPPPAAGHDQWYDFDRQVLGVDYENHYGKGAAVELMPVDEASHDPFTRGLFPRSAPHQARRVADSAAAGEVRRPWALASHLYKIVRPGPDVVGLVKAKSPDGSAEHLVCWTNRQRGGRVFATSAGAPGDFHDDRTRAMLVRGIHWCLDRAIP